MACFVGPKYWISTCGHIQYYKNLESGTAYHRIKTSQQVTNTIFLVFISGTKHTAPTFYVFPVYHLLSELASVKSISTWNSRSCLGNNLGISPRHSRSVYFVLNPVNGLVSPQFHCSFDDWSKTACLSANSATNAYNWKYLDGFMRGVSPSCTFTDTILWHIPGSNR